MWLWLVLIWLRCVLGLECGRVGSPMTVLVGSFVKVGCGRVGSYFRNRWGNVLGVFFYVSTFLHAPSVINYSLLRS